jgi:hypothetical protein
MRLMHKPLIATAIIALASVLYVNAQDTRPKFEVASVKPNPPHLGILRRILKSYVTFGNLA